MSDVAVAEFVGVLWAEGFAVQVSTLLAGHRVWVIVGSDDPARIEAREQMRFTAGSVGAMGLWVRESVRRAFRHTSR